MRKRQDDRIVRIARVARVARIARVVRIAQCNAIGRARGQLASDGRCGQMPVKQMAQLGQFLGRGIEFALSGQAFGAVEQRLDRPAILPGACGCHHFGVLGPVVEARAHDQLFELLRVFRTRAFRRGQQESEE